MGVVIPISAGVRAKAKKRRWWHWLGFTLIGAALMAIGAWFARLLLAV
jgi:hypothetical protein